MGLFERWQAAVDPSGIWQARREVRRTPAGPVRVERLQETALRAALNHDDAWNTRQAPHWRASDWPTDTLHRYGRMQSAWLTTVGAMLADAGFTPEAETVDMAAVWVAADRLRRSRVPGAQGGRLVLEAFALYGHPYPCEDAGLSWCQGWCSSDWRRWVWEWDNMTDAFRATELGEARGVTISEPGWLQFSRF